jgi:hypothetical protein
MRIGGFLLLKQGEASDAVSPPKDPISNGLAAGLAGRAREYSTVATVRPRAGPSPLPGATIFRGVARFARAPGCEGLSGYVLSRAGAHGIRRRPHRQRGPAQAPRGDDLRVLGACGGRKAVPAPEDRLDRVPRGSGPSRSSTVLSSGIGLYAACATLEARAVTLLNGLSMGSMTHGSAPPSSPSSSPKALSPGRLPAIRSRSARSTVRSAWLGTEGDVLPKSHSVTASATAPIGQAPFLCPNPPKTTGNCGNPSRGG